MEAELRWCADRALATKVAEGKASPGEKQQAREEYVTLGESVRRGEFGDSVAVLPLLLPAKP